MKYTVEELKANWGEWPEEVRDHALGNTGEALADWGVENFDMLTEGEQILLVWYQLTHRHANFLKERWSTLPDRARFGALRGVYFDRKWLLRNFDSFSSEERERAVLYQKNIDLRPLLRLRLGIDTGKNRALHARLMVELEYIPNVELALQGYGISPHFSEYNEEKEG